MTVSHAAKISALMPVMLLALLFTAAHAQPQGGAYRVIKTERMGAVSSDGILAGKTLYVAAQDGRNGDGSLPASFPQ